MTRTPDILAAVRESVPEVEHRADIGTDVLVLPASGLVDALTILRDRFGFELLSDVSGVDWLPREPRFDVNYHVTSIAHAERLRLKVQVSEAEARVPTATGVYPTANWHEREVFDFFGIAFDGHPDLRRILMPDEWIGHPLRKDYTVGGVPVEYKIEPAYVGQNVVGEQGRPAAGGVPARLRRDRADRPRYTWSGPPASGVPRDEPDETDA